MFTRFFLRAICIAIVLAPHLAIACVLDRPAPLVRLMGEADAAYQERVRANSAAFAAQEPIRARQNKLAQQANYWREADQVVLVEAARFRASHLPAPPPPKRLRRGTGLLPEPPPIVRLRPIEIDPFGPSLAVVSAWLKGHGRTQQISLSTQQTSCGPSGPALHLGANGLLLFAPRGPIRESTLLGYVDVDDVVDADIAAALVKLRQGGGR